MESPLLRADNAVIIFVISDSLNLSDFSTAAKLIFPTAPPETAERCDPVAFSARIVEFHPRGKIAQRLHRGNGFRHNKANDKGQQCDKQGTGKGMRIDTNAVQHADENIVHEIHRQ